MSKIITKGGVRLHCPNCKTDWIDSERCDFIPHNSPWRKGWEQELLSNPNKRYWQCPGCGNLIDRLHRDTKKEMMSNKEEITAVLTVKILISNSKDSVSKIEKTLNLKNPQKVDFIAVYGILTRSVIASLEFDGETDTPRHEGDNPSLRAGEGETPENQKDL